MIQRIQTVYLLLSVLCSALCLYMCLGELVSLTDAFHSQMYNLAVKNADGMLSFGVFPLFLVLALETSLALVTIFLYKKRTLQISLCTMSLFLLVTWYAIALYFVAIGEYSQYTFKPKVAFFLPIVSFILVILAKKGVKKDERLVRAADRIR